MGSLTKEKEMNDIKLRKYSIAICELFEDLLDMHNIDIPDDDREGEEDEARLYGTTYYDLEDAVTDILYKLIKDVENQVGKTINADNTTL